jgi:non-ribosomal peptide synthetase component F
LFHHASADRLIRHLRALLEAAAAGPEQQLSAMSLLDGQQREQVLSTFNQTARPAEGTQLLHQLITDQCQRTPSAAAVRFERQSVTFDQLDRWSSRS